MASFLLSYSIMQIKFSFTREEFQRAGLRARPLKLHNADHSMSVELIGPIDLKPGKGFWDLLSPGWSVGKMVTRLWKFQQRKWP